MQNLTTDSESKNLQKIQDTSLEDLTETERRTILAMMVAGSDKEAIELSPIGERRFYQLKPKLLKVKDEIKTALSGKAWDILLASVPKAALTLAKGLDQPSYKYQLEAAKDILDRVVGKAPQRVEEHSQITVLGITATTEEIEALKTPLTMLDSSSEDKVQA